MSDVELFTEYGHRTAAEPERARVVCLECPWFLHDARLSRDDLIRRGWEHRDATRLR